MGFFAVTTNTAESKAKEEKIRNKLNSITFNYL